MGVYVGRADGTGFAVDGSWVLSVVWSPDSRRIAIAREPVGGAPTVMVVEAESRAARTLGGGRWPLAWAPGSDRLVAHMDDGGTRIFSSADPPVVPGPQGVVKAWLADGRLLVVPPLDKQGEIVTMAADGSDVRPLTRGRPQPEWRGIELRDGRSGG